MAGMFLDKFKKGMPQTKPKIQVAIYARVSTKDKQDVENQLRELRRCLGFSCHAPPPFLNTKFCRPDPTPPKNLGFH